MHSGPVLLGEQHSCDLVVPVERGVLADGAEQVRSTRESLVSPTLTERLLGLSSRQQITKPRPYGPGGAS